jgi:hypothetical protein
MKQQNINTGKTNSYMKVGLRPVKWLVGKFKGRINACQRIEQLFLRIEFRTGNLPPKMFINAQEAIDMAIRQ